ncbi:hypothetical protein GQX74_013833 [Glossina fuscipes]|uniref:palmitoyl-protein hydrolase n=2 Tax=Nemorhina TaxID=44051 RepID=A0A1B0BMQ0_9MUSC|nr:hypothetical protein GQX74_013833 [Glossina fuscipes]
MKVEEEEQVQKSLRTISQSKTKQHSAPVVVLSLLRLQEILAKEIKAFFLLGILGRNMSNSAITTGTTVNNTSSLIFMHGLGDSGHGWCEMLGRVKLPDMKIICPNAPIQPVTLNNGFRMPSWFDIKQLDMSGTENEESLLAATSTIHELVDNEIGKGVPSTRIVLGGFSQGGALALYAALTYTKPLAGIIGLSTWLPVHQKFPNAKRNSNTIPIFQAHGDIDPVVRYNYGQLTAKILESFMENVTFHTYHGLMHSGSDQEMNDVKAFLQKCLR